MKIQELGKRGVIGIEGGSGLPSAQPKISFVTEMEKILRQSEFGAGFNQRVGEIQQKVLSSDVFSSRELLGLQMQLGRFNLQVELVSKLAESASATLRKLQNG